jgi:hypothetical protein
MASKLTELHLQGFGGNVEKIAGKKVHDKVMEGAEVIAKSTNAKDISVWMKQAIDRLDTCTTPEKCSQIMGACGSACYASHRKMVSGYKTRRMKHKTEAEFLQAELKQTVKNNRLELKDKNTLIQYYTPKNMKSNERCFCSLVKNLPQGTAMSPTYCQCSRAFIQNQWENALGRPLKVEVKETCLSGADECKFIIHL